MSEPAGKLALREKLSYGFGDLASVLYWQTFMLYFTYFYTDVFLIPASVAASLFLISRIWDGINDPLMGILSDRYKDQMGSFSSLSPLALCTVCSCRCAYVYRSRFWRDRKTDMGVYYVQSDDDDVHGN